MFGRVRAAIVKELLAVVRDPRGRVILIAPPLLQLLIFSYAATLEVSGITVAVLNRDAGRWGTELLHRMEASTFVRRTFAVDNLHALQVAIDTRQAILAVHLGPTFSRDIEAGRPADVQAILDGRRSNAAQIVNGYLNAVVEQLGVDVLARRGVAAVDPIAGRNWFNPNLDYIWYTVPSLVAVISLLMGLVVTALSVAREREIGTFDQIMVSPLRTHEILLGKTTAPLLIGLCHATVFVLAALFVFGVPLRGSLMLLYLSLLFYLAAVIGVGLFISSLSATQHQAILGAFLFAAPAVLLSGFATPIENMPEWLQTVTLVNPLRYFLVVVKGVFLKGLPIDEVLASTVPLILIASVTLTAAAWLFRRRME